MKGKRLNILIILLTIVLIFQVISYFEMKKYTTSAELHSLIDSYSNQMIDSISLISGELSTVMAEYREDQQWIINSNYEISKVNMTAETFKVKIEWTLADLAKDETIELLYRPVGQSKWEKLNFKNSGGLNYYTEQTLAINNNYETQVIASSKNGERSAELVKMYVKDSVLDRINIHNDIGKTSGNKYQVNVSIYNDYHNEIDAAFENEEKFKIKTVTGILAVDGKDVETFDLTEHADDDHDSIDVTYYIDLADYPGLNLKDVKEVTFRLTIEDHLGYQVKSEASSSD